MPPPVPAEVHRQPIPTWVGTWSPPELLLPWRARALGRHARDFRQWAGCPADSGRCLPCPPIRTPAAVYTMWYTLYMPKTVPVREFRRHLADLLDEVAQRREHVTITRHGRPEAVVIPVDEYEALEETAEILSDDDTLAAIQRGLDDLAADDVVPLDEVRQELRQRAES